MREFLEENQKHLLWQDEIGDEFILTKYLEIFEFDDVTLKCYCWSKKVVEEIAQYVLYSEYITDDGQRIPVFGLRVTTTDNGLYVFTVDVALLSILLETGIHKRRPSINGVWLQNLKRRLGHDIIKPENLNSINHTVKTYSVLINDKRIEVKAKSHKQAVYSAWKKHPEYDGKVTSMKVVSVTIMNDDDITTIKASEITK
jgi:hypothetical protein